MSNIFGLPVTGRTSGKVEPVLSAQLWVDYPQKPGVLRGASVQVGRGEILGLVGQSGSGKSTLSLAILGLLKHTGATVRGSILLAGHEVTSYGERQMREIRGRTASLIPQNPSAALNPVLRIGTQLRESWKAHASGSWQAQIPRVRSLLASSGLPDDDDFLKRFSSQISVGQAQRILIVMAILHEPALLIADEPTSALDMVTQREVLDLLLRINSERGMSILFISHDLISVAALCHKIAILHEGAIVESGATKEILASPLHPFTQKLIAAVPGWRDPR
jgi:ABC-type dipeptide/oligopeptide/nickel transport system ATPase component